MELAKEWRTEKYLRQLEVVHVLFPPVTFYGCRFHGSCGVVQAVMLVVDKDVSLMVTGLGDVIEPPDGVMAIGSGGGFALGSCGGGGGCSWYCYGLMSLVGLSPCSRCQGAVRHGAACDGHLQESNGNCC